MNNPKTNNLLPIILGVAFFLFVVTALTATFFINTNNEFENKKVEEILTIEEPYEAPPIEGISDWINTEPLTFEELKGKVVLVDFWTYSCINCIRNIPFINDWYDKYNDQGLEIIGMHTPEFEFEKNYDDVKRSVDEYNIQYPVAMDNDYETWNNFENIYWPALYFINKEGKVAHTHWGEGDYDVSERVIRYLLGLDELDEIDNQEYTPPISAEQTREIYLGYERAQEFENDFELEKDKASDYSQVTNLRQDHWTISGNWTITNENIISNSESKLFLNFSAKDVYLVMGSTEKSKIKVILNGETQELGDDVDESGYVEVNEYKLYHLVSMENFKNNNTLILEIPEDVKLNAFTFGS